MNETCDVWVYFCVQKKEIRLYVFFRFYGLAKLTTIILKDSEAEKVESSVPVNYLPDLSHINFEKMGTYVICSESIKNEHKRMLGMAKENVAMAFDIFSTGDEARLCEVEKNEEYIDYLNKEISKYITTVAAHDSTSAGSKVFNSLFTITGNIERIGDHATNIAEYAGLIKEKGIKFSEQAQAEITELKQISKKLFDELEDNSSDVVEWHGKIAALEQKIDDITIMFRNNMFARLQKGSCSDEGSILFSEMLTDFERIGDHALNISEEMVKIAILDN